MVNKFYIAMMKTILNVKIFSWSIHNNLFTFKLNNVYKNDCKKKKFKVKSLLW